MFNKNGNKVEVQHSKDVSYINHMNCSFHINNKQNKIRVDTSEKGYFLWIGTRGKEVLNRTQKFADIFNGVYSYNW